MIEIEKFKKEIEKFKKEIEKFNLLKNFFYYNIKNKTLNKLRIIFK